jgi:hypothetical protein
MKKTGQHQRQVLNEGRRSYAGLILDEDPWDVWQRSQVLSHHMIFCMDHLRPKCFDKRLQPVRKLLAFPIRHPERPKLKQRERDFQIASNSVWKRMSGSGFDDLFDPRAAFPEEHVGSRLVAAAQAKDSHLVPRRHAPEKLGDHSPTTVSAILPGSEGKQNQQSHVEHLSGREDRPAACPFLPASIQQILMHDQVCSQV